MGTILHITKRARWEKALKQGQYEPDSLVTQGFIHCSKPEQVISVANDLFCGQEDLVLLYIDPDKVASEICYENCKGYNELFPHIYGPLNLDSVTHICEFQALSDGSFVLPEKLRDNIC